MPTIEQEEQRTEFVDTKVGTQHRRLYPMRSSDKWLRENLSNAMQDAKVEIAIARKMESGAMGYTSTLRLYGYVPGDGGDDERGLDIRNRYRDWYARVSKQAPIAEQVCDRVCAWEVSIPRTASDLNMGRATTKRLLIYGLNESCILAGWGDQFSY